MRGGWSIQTRLTRGVLAAVGLAWLATVAIALLFLNYEMNEGFDQELALVARSTLLTMETGGAQVVGRLVVVTPGEESRVLRVARIGADEPRAPWGPVAQDGLWVQNGWRVLRQTGDFAVVEVAHYRNWRHEEVLEAGRSLFILLVPMLAILLWWLQQSLSAGLAPLRDLAARIEARPAQETAPLDLPAASDLPAELAPLAGGLADYLARITDLRTQERRFIGNAAHELRTPIAALRARLEGEGSASLPQVDALTRRVARLMELARAEAGLGLGRGPCDLVQVVGLVLEELPAFGGAGGDGLMRFDDSDLEGYPVALDPDALAIVLRNLLANALDHGTGPRLIRLSPAGDLTITNPTEETALPTAAFEKGPRSTGMGLGLAIVASLTEAMAVPMVQRIEGGRAEVRLSFGAHRL